MSRGGLSAYHASHGGCRRCPRPLGNCSTVKQAFARRFAEPPLIEFSQVTALLEQNGFRLALGFGQPDHANGPAVGLVALP
jgi:hypothetical protein